MRNFFRAGRLLSALAAALVLAACNDSTGATRVEGTYTLAAAGADGAAAGALPAVLYSGPANANGVQYNIRVELLEGNLVLSDEGSRYTYSGTFRISETSNRFPPETETAVETGTYIFSGGEIAFNESLNSEVHLAASGTLRNREIRVEGYDPFFTQDPIPIQLVFRR